MLGIILGIFIVVTTVSLEVVLNIAVSEFENFRTTMIRLGKEVVLAEQMVENQ